jgi:hypothetical protein
VPTQTRLTNVNALKIGTYFTWANKLWYVIDMTHDGERAYVEDCGTNNAKWMRTAHFGKRIKVVTIDA